MLMLQSTTLKRTPAGLPPDYINSSTTIALRELVLPKLVPGIIENPSTDLPNNVEPIISKLLCSVTADERFFLCCARWEFNANKSIDTEWVFYNATLNGTIDQYMKSIVNRYNGPSGSSLTAKDGCLCFKVLSVSQFTFLAYAWG
jgi:hypothetical protein